MFGLLLLACCCQHVAQCTIVHPQRAASMLAVSCSLVTHPPTASPNFQKTVYADSCLVCLLSNCTSAPSVPAALVHVHECCECSFRARVCSHTSATNCKKITVKSRRGFTRFINKVNITFNTFSKKILYIT